MISRGAIIRGDSTRKQIALVFTGDEYGEGASFIRRTLKKQNVPASFFLTGRFYRNPAFRSYITALKKDGHYLGAHSDAHLLYCDWTKRDSLLVNKDSFQADLLRNYAALKRFGIFKKDAWYFLPPYEWYNDTIAAWTKGMGLQLINFTPGTLSHADYTTPSERNYRSSETIEQSIRGFEATHANGLNGFILLMHIGTAPERTDKFYTRLSGLIHYLRQKGYQLVRVNDLLDNKLRP